MNFCVQLKLDADIQIFKTWMSASILNWTRRSKMFGRQLPTGGFWGPKEIVHQLPKCWELTGDMFPPPRQEVEVGVQIRFYWFKMTYNIGIVHFTWLGNKVLTCIIFHLSYLWKLISNQSSYVKPLQNRTPIQLVGYLIFEYIGRLSSWPRQ